MADADEVDRAAHVEALVRAARIERARAVRRLLQRLLRRTHAEGVWPAHAATGGCT